ncbi:uncharacterized protein LOC144705560 [Wolffia australiana]
MKGLAVAEEQAETVRRFLLLAIACEASPPSEMAEEDESWMTSSSWCFGGSSSAGSGGGSAAGDWIAPFPTAAAPIPYHQAVPSPAMNGGFNGPMMTIGDSRFPLHTQAMSADGGGDMYICRRERRRGRQAGRLPPAEKPSDDHFHWRKYGQKSVKGCEYPRSYYKCTFPECPVKKLVERDRHGFITATYYNGKHGHPETAPGPSDSDSDPVSTVTAHVDDEQLWDFPEDDDDATALPFLDDDDGERKEDEEDDDRDCLSRPQEGSSILDRLREPRVVIHTESEVDILDDGYRWRKYGQKVVKKNPNPRSYYKCTSVGCGVRKHVERAADDPKSVLTTYEGRHNHEVPASRGCNNAAAAAAAAAAAESSAAAADVAATRFKRKLDLSFLPGHLQRFLSMPYPPPLGLDGTAAMPPYGREFPLSIPLALYRAPCFPLPPSFGSSRPLKLHKTEPAAGHHQPPLPPLTPNQITKPDRPPSMASKTPSSPPTPTSFPDVNSIPPFLRNGGPLKLPRTKHAANHNQPLSSPDSQSNYQT